MYRRYWPWQSYDPVVYLRVSLVGGGSAGVFGLICA